MPGQGRKRSPDEVTPVLEGEVVPATDDELDEPAGREIGDELDDDAVEMNEDDEDDEDEEDEDEDDQDDEDEDEEDEEEDDEAEER